MGFLSLSFAGFVLVAIVTYYGIGLVAPRSQWAVLLIVSLLFYAFMADGYFFVPLLITACATWAGALAIERFPSRKRLVLFATLALCFIQLGYFKYWNTILYYLRVTPDHTGLGILLPLGISFYTFQSLGYLLDVYGGEISAEKNLARHLLFVTWFPQIIQGPINAYENTGAALFANRSFDVHAVFKGFLRFGYGVFKKYAIANTLLATENALFSNVGAETPGSIALYGVFIYSIQMYADFSGGIDMVEGISELFGIEMAQNFKQPYFSTSLSEFWQRWHMSLGAWMKKYVFYPLALAKPLQEIGRSAKKRFGRHMGRTIPPSIANVIVFFLVGLWHGAESHYLAWGIYNGVVIALSDLCTPLFKKLKAPLGTAMKTLPYRIFACVRTFLVVAVGRFFDRCVSVGAALLCLRNIFTNFMPMPFADALAGYGVDLSAPCGFPFIAMLACAIVFAISLAYELGVDVREWLIGLNPIALAAILSIFALFVAFSFWYIPSEGGGFIYANF